MSVKGQIFRELSTYLMATLQTTDPVLYPNGAFTPDMNLPGLKFVDKQMGQFNNLQLFNIIPLPAILIGFRKINWGSESRRKQVGNAIITFWVYYENYADSFTGSMNQDTALKFFDFNEEVHKALQGLQGSYFTALDRLSDEDDEDHDMIIGTIFEYSTVIDDDSADDFNKYTFVQDKQPDGRYVKQIERNDPDEVDDYQFLVP